MKLGQVQRPQEIAGCVELNLFDELSEHFSSPPRKHLHIVVQLPPAGEYPHHLFMFFILLIDVPFHSPAGIGTSPSLRLVPAAKSLIPP
jgi:hypothetical protein